MLVIKQNGRSKLGRTGNGIHMETNNNMETLNAVWPTAEQAGWRSVHVTVLILCAPGSPSSSDPLSETPPKGWQRSGERDIESEFLGRCLEPGWCLFPRASLTGERQAYLRGGDLVRVGFPAICKPVEAGQHGGTLRGSSLSYSTWF